MISLALQPEGIQQCYSASTFIDINNEEGGASVVSENLLIRIPPEFVPGSEKVNLHVYGKVLVCLYRLAIC